MVVTLTEVARRAGVSLATASRAFSDPDRLASATRDRVIAAATELGYEITAAPAGARDIGVIVPDISNAVMATLIRAMQDRLWMGRHRMVLASAHEDSSRERDFLAGMAGDVDGIILCSPRQEAESVLEAVGRTPLVVVNGEVDGAASVLMEMGEGIRQAVEHLYALGHRGIAFVPGPAASWANRRRLEAITHSAAEWDMELVVLGNQAATVQGGVAAAASVVASRATAVIAYNDLVALGVQSGVRAFGRSCPDDLSVIGIDDLDVAAASQPGLTSVQVAIERSGQLAVELILERMSGHAAPTSAVHLDSQLIVRGSTAPAREQIGHLSA
jgi:DNA-binding LacI/PurR family transcriptional regulator